MPIEVTQSRLLMKVLIEDSIKKACLYQREISIYMNNLAKEIKEEDLVGYIKLNYLMKKNNLMCKCYAELSSLLE